jgi:Protein of unknown function (DUF3631)
LFNGEQLVPETGDSFIGDPTDALQLVPMPHRTTNLRPRKRGEARFLMRRDDGLWRFIRRGNAPADYWWEAWQEKPAGGAPRVSYFGAAPGRVPGAIEDVPDQAENPQTEGERVRAVLEVWVFAQPERIEWPELPPEIQDRDADVWEPLIAVADLVGGEWPARSRAAAVALVAAARDAEPTLGIRLLADLRAVFGGADHMSTATILSRLCEIDEAPWRNLKGKPIDDRGLARRLRQYGVKSKTVRIGDATPKGYVRADLEDAWERYIPSMPARSATSATAATSRETGGSLSATATSGAQAQQKSSMESMDVADVADVADLAGYGRGPGHDVAVNGTAGATPSATFEERRCDHCGRVGASGHWDWPGRPDGIWLHESCQHAWMDSEGVRGEAG